MTHAWSVAMLLNVEDKVKPLLFDAVQKNKLLKQQMIFAMYLSALVSVQMTMMLHGIALP